MEMSENISELIKQLDYDLEDLEDALAPLITYALSETASKIPLLDRAKLYVLATYAIESIIFSFLRLNGANAKEHSVFKELNRVKQYFEKIKIAENGKQGPNLRVDKAAAGRIVKHALAHREVRGNAVYASDQPTGTSEHTSQATLNKRKFDEVEAARSEEWRGKPTETGSDSNSSASPDESSSSSEAEAEPHNASTAGQPVLEPGTADVPKKTIDLSHQALKKRGYKAKKAKLQGQAGGQGKPSGSSVLNASKKKNRKNKSKGVRKGGKTSE